MNAHGLFHLNHLTKLIYICDEKSDMTSVPALIGQMSLTLYVYPHIIIYNDIAKYIFIYHITEYG